MARHQPHAGICANLHATAAALAGTLRARRCGPLPPAAHQVLHGPPAAGHVLGALPAHKHLPALLQPKVILSDPFHSLAKQAAVEDPALADQEPRDMGMQLRWDNGQRESKQLAWCTRMQLAYSLFQGTSEADQ
jgi:hypothetical protein